MRFMKTFVLHLYVDSDEPERLCGDLQALPNRKARPFKNQAELMDLFLESIRQVPEKTPTSQVTSNRDASEN